MSLEPVSSCRGWAQLSFGVLLKFELVLCVCREWLEDFYSRFAISRSIGRAIFFQYPIQRAFARAQSKSAKKAVPRQLRYAKRSDPPLRGESGYLENKSVTESLVRRVHYPHGFSY